ncbi:hypothetical protein RRG08_041017 [Elysia crispata]|uniref:Uncharacterized protein n=1 Tax=Elysia crispata TaxID=231223 RepID=A0AAE1BDU1_9GAST|nr:hypothetical protein RRG08_041017 [Elysia crispata]
MSAAETWKPDYSTLSGAQAQEQRGVECVLVNLTAAKVWGKKDKIESDQIGTVYPVVTFFVVGVVCSQEIEDHINKSSKAFRNAYAFGINYDVLQIPTYLSRATFRNAHLSDLDFCHRLRIVVKLESFSTAPVSCHSDTD